MPDKPNQDAVIMEDDEAEDMVLLAVFDGHGDHGHLVSRMLAEGLPVRVLPSHAAELCRRAALDAGESEDEAARRAEEVRRYVSERMHKDAGAVIREALLDIENRVLGTDGLDSMFSGSTACVALVHGDQLTIAHVGDSRGTLLELMDGGAALRSRLVTQDHKPTVRSETRRIMLAGGELRAIRYGDGTDGPVRVWVKGRDVPGLAMSRSIGDESGKLAGVISEPDIQRTTLSGKDAVLLLASDGLWEFISVEEVSAAIHAAYQDARTLAAATGDPANNNALRTAIDQLCTEATSRWIEREGCVDDISIILAEIHCGDP